MSPMTACAVFWLESAWFGRKTKTQPDYLFCCLHYLQELVFFPYLFPLHLILDYIFLGFLAAAVKALLLPTGGGWLLFLWEVGGLVGFDFLLR